MKIKKKKLNIWNDKNKKNAISNECDVFVIPNECEGSYFQLLLLFRLFKDFNNIHLLFLIYRISKPLLVNTIFTLDRMLKWIITINCKIVFRADLV